MPCKKCNKKSKYYPVKGRKCYECGNCGHQLYPMVESIFERSSTSLWTWFQAIWMIGNAKNGVSAKEIERCCGVTYKTAWSMCHKIRKAMAEDVGLLSGIIEMDESQIGGKKNKNKFYIFGMVERGGKAQIEIVKARPKGEELIPIIKKKVKRGAKIYTDKYGAYHSLGSEGYKHKSISHKKTYAHRKVSTNRIEGLWSSFKNSILGTHRHVSRKWLRSYLNEFVFKYNRRKERSIVLDMLERMKPDITSS